MSSRIQRLLISTPSVDVSLEEAINQEQFYNVTDEIASIEYTRHCDDVEELLSIAHSLEAINNACLEDADYQHPVTNTMLGIFANNLGVEHAVISTEAGIVETVERIYKAIKEAIQKAFAVFVIWLLKFNSRSESVKKRADARKKSADKVEEADVSVEVKDHLEQLAADGKVDLNAVADTVINLSVMLDKLVKEITQLTNDFTKADSADAIMNVENGIDDLIKIVEQSIPMKKSDDGYESKDILPGDHRLVVNFESTTPVFMFRKESVKGGDLAFTTTLNEMLVLLDIAAESSLFAKLNKHLNDSKENGIIKALDNRINKLDTESNKSAYVQGYLTLGNKLNTLNALPQTRISQYIVTIADHVERVTGKVETATKIMA